MTVITKAIGEKKPADKMEQPLVVDDVPTAEPGTDPEAQCPHRGTGPFLPIKDKFFIVRRPNIRSNVLTLYCLLFTAILGVSIGVIGGLYLYKHCARDQMHRFRTGWYSIAYEGSNRSPIGREPQADQFKTLGVVKDHTPDLPQSMKETVSGNLFKERFEIDLEAEDYEQIDVPDFRGGRQGRFIHDFTNNLTGIIDIDGNCCYVMPLNRKRVLPPRSMYDLLNKMYNGYYEVNTEVVRETMRVIFPRIHDRSSVGAYIGRECKHMPIYRLEKVNYTGIAKRSASDGVFGQFAGESIVEFSILNIDDVLNDK